MKTSMLCLLCFLFLSTAFSQKSPMKWGKVPQEDLEMTEYSLDSEAEAVVLGDVGRITFDFSTGTLFYRMEYHKRIKILKQSAFDRGDIAVSYYSPNNYEVIKGLKAQVIMPDGEKIAVKKIYDEKINEYWSRKKFAFPNLKEGCVIEYKYTKTSKGYFNLEDWYFQGDIPVRISQLSTEIPEWYQYVSFTQGRKAKVETSSRHAQIMVPDAGLYDKVNTKLDFTNYIMEDIPALKAEPHITTMKDYYAKIQFQLQMIRYPSDSVKEIDNTWKKVEKDLMEHQYFGDQILKKRYCKKMWAELEPVLASVQSKEERLAIIRKFISTNLIWDETYQFMVENTLDDAFESKSANSGELNLILIALCRQAEIDAHPVLISTRSHGRMLPVYPKVDQFNHTIAYVYLDGKEYLFDIGSSFRAPNLLRENSLNYKGWLVRPDLSQWISIDAPNDKEVCMANFKLSPEGDLIGDLQLSFEGYGAMEQRFVCNKEPDLKKLKEEWMEKFVDIKIDSIQLENEKELDKAFKTNIFCTIPGAVQAVGDFMYIMPILDAYTENPYKLEEREYAIDMTYGFKNQYILNLTIPEGYVVDELPEGINLKLPNNGGKFQFFVSQKGNTIQIVNKVSISQLHYEPEEYLTIKNFYDIIVEKHSEQIVLKKAT